MTKIQWTDAVWNPVVGCSRVSPGCQACYAEKVAHRGMSPQHRGLTVLGKHGPRWTGEVRFLPDRLGEPLRWRKPRRVFVNSMSDLFHEKLTNEQIAAVFGVMAACPTHTFQVLTKRPERMREWFRWAAGEIGSLRSDALWRMRRWAIALSPQSLAPYALKLPLDVHAGGQDWPLVNVWLGVSCENQQTADERIPLLLDTPAAIRWVSYEPALGPIDFTHLRYGNGDFLDALRPNSYRGGLDSNALDWVVIGGESGTSRLTCGAASAATNRTGPIA